MRPFQPLVRNPHLLTIFANFAQRRLDTRRYPVESVYRETEAGVRVLVHVQRPSSQSVGDILMVHGLEGSSNAGYMRSMSQLALEHGYTVHRMNMRGCGTTDPDCTDMYHAGLTSDTLSILREIVGAGSGPVFLVGYSLGGNVSLKLAGELGEQGPELLRGVCGVSTPIDLTACVRKMSEPQNRIYEWRFLSRLKARIRRRERRTPGFYPPGMLRDIRSVFEFDDKLTAPSFGFGSAVNYYASQSSKNFLHLIRVPTLLVQAQDDPLIPFDIFSDAAIAANPHIQLHTVSYGGHLGFLANAAPHFWVDRLILEWIDEIRARSTAGV